MAHLFLAGEVAVPNELYVKGGARIPRTAVRIPTSVSAEKLSRDRVRKDRGVVVTTRVPHVNEAPLTVASSGAETSCSRCMLPSGVVVFIAGVVVTAVAYAVNSQGFNVYVLGLVLLAVGLGLVASSAVCWRVRLRKRRRRDKRRESQTALMAGQRFYVA